MIAERLAPLVFSGCPAQLERLGEEQDLGERGAELVRDAGGEVGAQPGQLLLPPELPDGDHAEPGREREQAEQQRQPAAGLDQRQPRGDLGRERRPGRDGRERNPKPEPRRRLAPAAGPACQSRLPSGVRTSSAARSAFGDASGDRRREQRAAAGAPAESTAASAERQTTTP